MGDPLYKVIRGTLHPKGKEPDGDSVRFLAETPSSYDDLHLPGAPRLAPGDFQRGDFQRGDFQRGRVLPSQVDGTVQLRLEGIDAPELHYGGATQPMSAACRDALLTDLGFRRVAYRPERPNMVADCEPPHSEVAILTQSTDVHGRPICYLLPQHAAASLSHGARVRVDDALLEQSVNAKLLSEGHAYFLAYRSTPEAHRSFFRAKAQVARSRHRGVWELDSTAEFTLDGRASIEVGGQLILPKLFRRCIDYLKDVAFQGDLTAWLARSTGTGIAQDENDLLEVAGGAPVRLSELVSHQGKKVTFSADVLTLTFFEKEP